MTSKNKQFYSVIVNALVFKGDKLLIAQRGMNESHHPGRWSIPGGKVETIGYTFNAIEETAKREVREETGIEIKDKMELMCNNTFNRSNGELVLALMVICDYKFGKANPLEDTMAVKWISNKEIDNFNFSESVLEYIKRGFIKHNE